MPPSTRPDIIVSDLFEELMTSDQELRGFIGRLEMGPRLLGVLPGAGTPLAHLCFESGRTLKAWGLIDQALFLALFKAYPGQHALIAKAWEQLWSGQAPPAPAQGPAPAQAPAAPSAGGLEVQRPQELQNLVVSISASKDRIETRMALRHTALAGILPVKEELRKTLVAQAGALKGGDANREDARKMGLALGELLAHPDLGSLVVQMQNRLAEAMQNPQGPKTVIRVEFRLSEGWHHVPWELTRAPGQGGQALSMSPDVVLTRVMEHAVAALNLPRGPKPRVLVITTLAPDADEYIKKNVALIKGVWGEDAVDVIHRATNSRLTEFREDALLDFPQTAPYVMAQLIAHGNAQGIRMFDGSLMSAEIFAQKLHNLVSDVCVINACNGGSQPMVASELPGLAWKSVAGELAAVGIRDVVAMGDVLSMADAQTITKIFHHHYKRTLDAGRASAAARYSLISSPNSSYGFLVHLSAHSYTVK